MITNTRIVPRLNLLLALLSIALLATCSKDKPTDPPAGGGGTIAGATVVPSSSAGPSMSSIALSGLPSDTISYYGIVLSAAVPIAASAMVNDTAYTPIIRTDSGDYLLMPLNPGSPNGGGEVSILITDGIGNYSAPIPLTIDSLPEAPGEMAAVTDLWQQVFTHQLRLAGLTRGDLVVDGADPTPIEQVPFIEIYDALDNPDNLNSLRALADGTAQLLTETPFDMDIVNRLLALTDYRGFLEDYVAALDTVTPFGFDTTSDTINARWAGERIYSSSVCIPAPDFGITTCGALAQAMRKQQELQDDANSIAEKVKYDIASSSFTLLGLWPGAKPAAAFLSSTVFINSKIEEGQLNLYPSEFVDAATNFDPSITEFKEDYTEKGKWTKFEVTAVSKGWTLDKTVVETVLKFLSLKSSYSQYADEIGNFEDFSSQLGETLSKAATSKGKEKILKELGGLTNIIEICPNTWSNINCAEETYSTTTVLSGELYIDESAKTYEPFEVGPSTFKIETNGEFGENLTGYAVAINTKAIEVFIDPFEADADTSETLNFTVRVENAEDERVEFSLPDGGTMVSQTFSTATVRTPSSPWNPPIRLHAKSLAATGLRDETSEERYDDAPITYNGIGDLAISPPNVCLKPNESQEYIAIYTGGNINDVVWETIPPGIGDFSGITDSGLGITYTAPGTLEGLITIKATVNDSISAMVNVDISECNCRWNITGGGPNFTGGGGNFAYYEDLGALAVYMYQGLNSFEYPYAAMVVYNVTGEGNYKTPALTYYLSDDLYWTVNDTLESMWPDVEITDAVPGGPVRGTVSGQLSRRININPLEYEYINFDLEFSAEYGGVADSLLCNPEN